MRFFLMMCSDATEPSEPTEADFVATDAWAADLERRGMLSVGSRLGDAGEATTVRIRGERALITDGPFVESHEQIGGFEVVDCASLDEAVAIAAAHPAARLGRIDVRAFLGD